MKAEQLAILGAGRAGCAIFGQLAAVGYTPGMLWTRSHRTAEAARHEGYPVVTGTALPDLSGKSLALLAVSDSAVASLAAQLSATALPHDLLIAHVSGALDLAPLAPLADRGLAVGSLHPLVSIATRTTRLAGAASVEASTPAADATLSDLAQRLGFLVIRPRGNRAAYHAAASIVGNFPQVLLQAASQILAEMGLTADEAGQAVGPLLESASRNAAQLGPAQGLTGPIARGDVEVVRRHLAAIHGSDVEALYLSAARIALALAREMGSPRADEIDALLHQVQ